MRRTLRLIGTAFGVLIWTAAALAAPPHVTLEEFVEIPARSFAGDQPVQGVSSIAPGPGRNLWWALSDNGYGTRENSGGYVLSIYLFEIASRATLLERLTLRDPNHLFPWPLTRKDDAARTFTGADADPESMVVMPDGSFWLGEELGPWLLHFSRLGELLEPPVLPPLPAGVTLRVSRGFEGLAPGPAPGTLVAMLEGAMPGDAPDVLRLFEFDLASKKWTGRFWLYPLDAPSHSGCELVRAGDHHLIIERDDREGDAAKFKRIFAVQFGTETRLVKNLVVDLLAIDNPKGLGDGASTFRFPFITTESVWPIDAHTLEVVNDNNYPSGDPTQWIRLRLE